MSGQHANAITGYLAELGRALAAWGWSSQLRSGEAAPFLRVWHHVISQVGESVGIAENPGDGRLWFAAASKRWLAPVDRPKTAACELIGYLWPYVSEAWVQLEEPDAQRRPASPVVPLPDAPPSDGTSRGRHRRNGRRR